MYFKSFLRQVALALLVSEAVLHGQNNVLSVGYTAPVFNVAPGQIVTLFTPPLSVPDAVADQVPLPTSLSGVSVSVRVPGSGFDSTGYPSSLPILRVYSSTACQWLSAAPCPNTQITVEIPTEGVCAQLHQPCSTPYRDIPPTLILNVKANGLTGPDQPVSVGTDVPHLLSSCDSIFGPPGKDCHPLVTHADGSLVALTSPAAVGETITIYAVGLNDRPEAPIYRKTGYPVDSPIAIDPALSQVKFSYRLEPSPGAQFSIYAPVDHFVSPQWAGLTAGYVGLFQINVTIPPVLPGTAPCQGAYNTAVQLENQLSGTIYLCVQP